MKYVTTVVLMGWTVYILYTMPNLTGEDNFILYLLCLVTFVCTLWNMVLILKDFAEEKE